MLSVSNLLPLQDVKQYLFDMSEFPFDVKLDFEIYMKKSLQCLYMVRESTLLLIKVTGSLILGIFLNNFNFVCMEKLIVVYLLCFFPYFV